MKGWMRSIWTFEGAYVYPAESCYTALTPVGCFDIGFDVARSL